MATEQDQDDSPDEPGSDATDAESGEPDAAENDLVSQPNPSEAVAAVSPPAIAPAEAPTPSVAAAQPGNLAALSAQLREAAAQIAEIAAQAGRLGVAIYAAKALRDGTEPEALRRLVLERASAAADARDVVAAAPSHVLPQTKESPIVAAAKRAAADGKRR